MLERYPVVYIMTNKRNETIYTGVTSNIAQRVYQHKQSAFPRFTKPYGCRRLVYYEQSAKRKAQSAKRKAQSAKRKAQSAK